MTTPTSAFALIGILFSLNQLQKWLGFIWFYFLRPTTGYKAYLKGHSPYAFITGGADGIGKGIARELYLKGFNLILHGKYEEEMVRVVEDLRALGGKARENIDIRTFVAEATATDLDFEGIAKKFQGLNITILVNNVGGTTVKNTTIDGWEEKELLDLIRLNATFHVLLTRALLPSLRATSRRHPVLVAFTGSFAGETSFPRIPLYSAAKAFTCRLAQSLHGDERFDSEDSKLSFMYFEVGHVKTNLMTLPVTWKRPSADGYGKFVVNSFGCGKQVVTPYFGHAVIFNLMRLLPASILSKRLKTETIEILEMMAKR